MAEATVHKGGCHCGAVRYEVTTALEPVITCNCSICSRKGTLLTFVPADAFKLLAGKDAVSDYQFNTKNIHHLFCKTCGVESFATGTAPNGAKMVAVNVRCLDDVDPETLQPVKYDGKNM
ncbi:GFA family protein [Ferrovibrio sp.]|uniref:GFA family protein n=1 Tax=Ferrovibrio sp. TaxID=1917215 RepID=UPI002611F752|nr:GFA family protein [Ferrovibrio sp.]